MLGTLEMVILAMIKVYLLFFLFLEIETFFFLFLGLLQLGTKDVLFSSLPCN